MAFKGGKPRGGKKRKAAVLADGSAQDNKVASAAGVGASTFQVPEASEVLEIARTRNLYKSNLFRLQLEELLKEMTPAKSCPGLEEFLRELQVQLEGLSTRTIPEGLASEFPQLFFHQQQLWAIPFSPPKRIDIVGGYLLGTCMRSEMHIDVALEMPTDIFQAKDYLNFRYLDKRAAYVGEVYRQLEKTRAAGISDGPLAGMTLCLEALQGDLFRPCVSVSPRKKAGGGEAPWVVRLLPAYPPDLWASTKLAPERNAVRPLGTDAKLNSAVTALPPTAHYNSCVLEDAHMRTHLELLHRAINRIPALRDAILLLKKWARAHGFTAQPPRRAVFTPLSGFCLSMLAVHAEQGAAIAPAEASPLQLFKLALNALASTDWANQKLVLGKTAAAALSEKERHACGAHFYDTDGTLNFFWRLGPFIQEIQWEAKRALHVLDTEVDPFEAVFGLSASPELLWDVAVRTSPLGTGALCPDLNGNGAGQGADAAQATSPPSGPSGAEPADVPEALLVASRFSAVLKAGLRDRVLRVVTRLVGNQQIRWSTDRPCETIAVVVGLLLDSTSLDRAVDQGPSAQDTVTSSEFRTLWGAEKSELRRFKDGSILECVVWSKPPAQRSIETKDHPAVITQIISHLAKRHVCHAAEGMEIVSGPIGIVPNLYERPRRLWTAFEAFRTHICQLSSLPLTVKDVHPVDAEFSYSEVVPCSAPMLDSDSFPRTLHHVVVEFEVSGKWPSDAAASRKVAGALLLQMREELQQDLGIEAHTTEGFLDVRYPEETFRVQIFHPRELVDVAHRVTNFQAKTSSPMPSGADLERLRLLWWRPRLRSALHGHVLQKPALAGAIRLCKRWMASQLLAGYDEFVEHLVAFVFLQPAPFDTPTSSQMGFCRVCWLLRMFDWQHEPLVVDFDGKLTEDQRLIMRQSFEAGHVEGQRVTPFWICSRFDPHALLLGRPPATVGAWLQRRASQALEVYNRRLLGAAKQPTASWQSLFAIDTSVFDLVVRLTPQTVVPGGSKKARRSATVSQEAVRAIVDKLREHFSPACLVFYGMDGEVIAVKWRPNAFIPQQQGALMGAIPQTMVKARNGKSMFCVPNVLCLTSMIVSLAEGLAVDVAVIGMRN